MIFGLFEMNIAKLNYLHGKSSKKMFKVTSKTKVTIKNLLENLKNKTKSFEYMKNILMTATQSVTAEVEELLKHATFKTWPIENTVRVKNQVCLIII